MKRAWLRLFALLLGAGCAAPRPVAPPANESAADLVPFGAEARAAELAELRDLLRDTYSHLETKRAQWGVTPEEAFKIYEPLVRRADTWGRLERVMVGFVSEFHDAHLAWRRTRGAGERKRRIVRLGLDSRFVGDALLLTEVWSSSGAERAGLRVGDRIVGVDGETIEERLGGRAALRSWSRLESARYDFAQEWPASRVDEGAEVLPRRVTRERADGTYETLAVIPETAARPERKKPVVWLDRKGERTVLRVRRLPQGDREVELFESTLDTLIGEIYERSSGLVIDLRDNPGGFEETARGIVARFSMRTIEAGAVRVRLSSRARAARPVFRKMEEDPSRPGWSLPRPLVAEAKASRAYPGRIAVVIDAGCRSSCEAMALLFRELGGRLFGQRTGGSSGAPITLLLPRSGARVTIPVWAMLDRGGEPIEGRGVAPDEVVTETKDDVMTGRDAPLEAAARWAAAGGR